MVGQPGSMLSKSVAVEMDGEPDSFRDREHGSAPGGRTATGRDAESPQFGPRSIGDFEILRELGRGGTSIVYEARETRLRRKVALKRLPAAAAFDERWLERFRNEVRTAAQLNHPNIVTFFDTGHDDGAYFFTMQLVDGVSLAEVIEHLRQCRDRVAGAPPPCRTSGGKAVHPALARLCERCGCRHAGPGGTASPDAASDLPPLGAHGEVLAGHCYHEAVSRMILDAARALDYAHERGVLHLDIKPSNLLLNGEGKVWVTDFGAASSGSSGDSPAAAGRVGTLRYMSPEQLLAGNEQVDRRSDVYSLGATLYELLTLRSSFADRTQSSDSPYSAIRRYGSPRELNPAIPRELDAVVHRATAQVPDQRYATAGELADDLQRFLESKPVQARPPGRLHRRANWTARQRVWIGTSLSILLIALFMAVAGLRLFSGRQPGEGDEGTRAGGPGQLAARTAEEQRAARAHCAAVVTEINRILTEDVRGQPPDRGLVGAPMNLLRTLDQAAGEIEEDSTGEPALESDLHRSVADTYARLGEYRKAATHYQAALRALGSQEDLADPRALPVNIALGAALSELGEWDEARELLDRCLQAGRALGIEQAAVRDAVIHLHKLAQMQDAKDDDVNTELVDLLSQHLAARRKGPAEDDRETLSAAQALAELLLDAGDHEEAWSLLQEVVTGRQRLLGPEHRDTLAAQHHLALSMLYQGKLTEAETALRANLEARRRLLGDTHLDTLESATDLAALRTVQNQLDEAETLFRQAHAGYREILGIEHPETVDWLTNVARILAMRNQLRESQRLYREAWEIVCRTRGEQHPQAIQTAVLLGRLLRQQGDYDEAEEVDRQNLAAARQTLAAAHTLRGEAVIQRLLTLHALHRPDEAETVGWDERAAIFGKDDSPADADLLAVGFLDSGELADAEQWVREASDGKRASCPPEPPISAAETLALLGRILMAQDRLEEAEQVFRECLVIRQAALPEGCSLIAETESLLGDCLARHGSYADAEPLLVNAVESGSPSGSSAPARSVDRLERLVSLYDRWSKPEETQRWGERLERELREILAGQEPAPPPGHWSTLEIESRLGACLAVLSRVEESRAILHRSHTALSVLCLREGQNPSTDLRRVLRQTRDRIVWFHQRHKESELADACQMLQLIELDRPNAEPANHAIAAWEDVGRRYPDELNYVMHLGIIYQRLAKGIRKDSELEEALSWYSKAEEVFSRVRRTDPQHDLAGELLGQCYTERARAHMRLGHLAECFADYEQALRIRPDHWGLGREAAWAMADVPDPARRNLERAMSLALHVAERDADNPSSWCVLGSVQCRAGQWAEATESLDRAIQPSHGDGCLRPYLFLAMAHWQLGASHMARECYQDAVDRMSGTKRVPPDLLRYRREAAELLGIREPSATKKQPAQ
ncbi:MAG: tetratricopeptide repeat protein [Planctomycetes bacterium]|nr:tetratricopeptide repeat protein [Planctomycetota bacterium]